MSRVLRPVLLLPVAVALLGGYALRARVAAHDPHLAALLADWFQPVGFAACGLATLARVLGRREERLPWALLGAGLVLYALGSVTFNVAYGNRPAPAFPNVGDALWLSLYPLAGAAMVVLLRRRFPRESAGVWLDGAIGGAVVAAVAAAVLYQPVLALPLDGDAARFARLAYPLGDVVLLGFIVGVWSLSGLRLSASWALLGCGFALLAVSDGSYVVQAAHGDWSPGSLLDLPYVLATAAFAGAAWARPPQPPQRPATPVGMPVAFALSAVLLTGLAVIGNLNALASGLALGSLVAVVVRLGLTLGSLTRQRAELAAQASTDALTGLANHRLFHERLAQELARARRERSHLSVVTFDLDHFKVVNDTYGHAEGDAALQAVARVLQRQARACDVVARLGGEEFGLILPGAGGGRAQAVAERCRVALSELRVQGLPVSCSGGVASFPEDDPGGARLLDLADGALYWAKRAGRAQIRRYDAGEVVLLSGGEQSEQVRALLADPGAVTPVFQPIVELSSGRIAGYEALSRFPGTEPVRPPDQWFAQARRCGLGPALEARAIAVALAVPGRPPGTFLSVNVSARALVSPEVAAVLPDDLDDLVIELTENDLFECEPELDAALARLRARGARIAIDDAGTGYSGLQQMVRVKPDILKLDRSLISGIHLDALKIALLDAMARFATTTGAAVCAEGIEEADEVRLLGRFDIAYGQGYALGRPGPAWPAVDAAVAAHASAEARSGMRMVAGAATLAGELTGADVADALARVRTSEELDAALAPIERLLRADEVAVSRVIAAERCVETVTTHAWAPPGERFALDEYPTTEHVITHQTLGHVFDGDPVADSAEIEVLRREGYGAVLLAPIVSHGETVGLLELYRRAPRPWAATDVDQVRLVAHQLSAVLASSAVVAPSRG